MQTDDLEKPKLHIAIAPPKNIERFEWFAEKVTEIGVAEITPLWCKHSERKELRTDRIEKILLGACKQSLKLTLPKLNSMTRFETFVKQEQNKAQKYIAYCDEKAIHLKNAYRGNFDAVIMIGPEGDFTKEEVLLAEKQEFETVSLGKSRLRLETAGIFACSVFNLANE
jgi:16S rRNA (uracil1498-N3)-methyltransferase